MLSFPSQIMVFAVVALLGINVQNVILANVFMKWAWYARTDPQQVLCSTAIEILFSFHVVLVPRSILSCFVIWCHP